MSIDGNSGLISTFIPGISPVSIGISKPSGIEGRSGRVVFYNSVGGAIAPGGNDVVLNLHYDGSEILSAIVQFGCLFTSKF